MFNKKLFGQRIHTLRLRKNESQQELASHLGIGKSAVSMIENGQRAASAEILTALADYFDVSLDYLTGTGVYGQMEQCPPLRQYLAAALDQYGGALLGGVPAAELDDEQLGLLASALFSSIKVTQTGEKAYDIALTLRFPDPSKLSEALEQQ